MVQQRQPVDRTVRSMNQMEHRLVGTTGVEVSRLILGCGNFGGIGSSPAFFGRGTSKDDAFALMDAAWEAGLTTFDTADAYGGGNSETFIGEWLAHKDASVRDRITLTTKTYNPMAQGADSGLSRDRMVRQIDTSLGRLGVERVALYLAHEFDPTVPIEQTMAGFEELVRAGKVGAVGASNFSADQLQRSLDTSTQLGVVRYWWVQNSFSLLERGDAKDVVPLCADQQLGYSPFSPLAGGWLTGKYRRGTTPPVGSRMTLRPEPYAPYLTDRVFDALEALERLAAEQGTSMAAMSLAWLLAQPGITAVVIGPNRVEQMTPALEALHLTLSPDVLAHLSELFS
jgi:aryl-alcohol dehydrogenase-like predicted oxidoreductase